ncbi:MAG: hypothetical protein N3E48_02285 [Candidatus Bathyarchaeota archaeon]|nr:hypothetical protein [Candidatus Bathyarchaeota archaeon]
MFRLEFKNFMEDFPANLLNLSFKSLSKIRGEILEVYNAPSTDGFQDYFTENEMLIIGNMPINMDDRLIRLKPLNNPLTSVIGLDTSQRRIGVTKDGIIYAFRGAIVWKDAYAYRYLRYGPFIFHFTCLDGVFERDEAKPVNNPLDIKHQPQNIFEKFLQWHVAHTVSNSIIIFDGCLSNQSTNHKILELARKKGNKVLAISKKSKVYVDNKSILPRLKEFPPPWMLRIDDLLPSNISTSLLGKVFIAKFSSESIEFRVDIDGKLCFEDIVNSIGELIGNDVLSQGYPETLRLAHILSTFTRIEVLGIQRLITKKLGVKVRKLQSTRKILFGPFAK